MKRRTFVKLIGGAMIAPLTARAQPMPVIGFLDSGAPDNMGVNLVSFRSGLGETGLTEGQNVRVEYRWARGDYGRLPALAAELVRQPVAVIAASRGPGPARA